MLDMFYWFCAPATGLIVASLVAASIRRRYGFAISALLGFVFGGIAWFIAGTLILSTLR